MKFSQKIALAYIRTKYRVLSLISPQKTAEKAFTLFCTPRRKKPGAVALIVAEAERLQLTVNDLELYGHRWNRGALKKLLIVHGFQSSAANFSDFVLPLVTKGYEVVAFDAQAHGNSAGKTIILPEYVATLEAAYKTFGAF